MPRTNSSKRHNDHDDVDESEDNEDRDMVKNDSKKGQKKKSKSGKNKKSKGRSGGYSRSRNNENDNSNDNDNDYIGNDDNDDDGDDDIEMDMSIGKSLKKNKSSRLNNRNNRNDQEDLKQDNENESDTGSTTESESKAENYVDVLEMRQGRGRRSRQGGDAIIKKYCAKMEEIRFKDQIGNPINGCSRYRYNETTRVKVGGSVEIQLALDKWVSGWIHKIEHEQFDQDKENRYDLMTDNEKTLRLKKARTNIIVRWRNDENNVESRQYGLNSNNLRIIGRGGARSTVRMEEIENAKKRAALKKKDKLSQKRNESGKARKSRKARSQRSSARRASSRQKSKSQKRSLNEFQM